MFSNTLSLSPAVPLTDMRVLDVLDEIAQAGERDSAAVELADVDQKHGHGGGGGCSGWRIGVGVLVAGRGESRWDGAGGGREVDQEDGTGLMFR